jgi:general transcriptional corepressor CYC8
VHWCLPSRVSFFGHEPLQFFRYILNDPPHPLSTPDIWFQIGHVYELSNQFDSAREAYERVLAENPNHVKVLQQLGWLYHHNATFGNQDVAIQFLLRSLDADQADGQTWYLLGRCFMTQQKYRKAYDAYQQAIYRDGRNPTFWCSIGVLYYQINQPRDALDAYSRAIRLNPYLSEVWYDLGTLYESCSQIEDALDAYQRAAQLDPKNSHIRERLDVLRSRQPDGMHAGRLSSVPEPRHPTIPIAHNAAMHQHPSAGVNVPMFPGSGIPSLSQMIPPGGDHSTNAAAITSSVSRFVVRVFVPCGVSVSVSVSL